MKYYLKRLGHQELGSVKNGKAQRGRYIYISRVIADEFKREAKRNILEARNGDDE